jgi:carboxyl-terminal processing protease
MKLKILSFIIISLISQYSTAGNVNQNINEEVPVEVLKNFIDVYHVVKTNYVDPVDSEKLMQDAMKGMVANLDPHSQFLDKSEREDLMAGISGEFAGIGIEIQVQDKGLKVIAPIDSTPAQRAGIKSGDIIYKINDVLLSTLTSPTEALKYLKGNPGEKVSVGIMRDKKEMNFDMKKEIIKVKTTKSNLVENKFGYVKVNIFQKDTAIELSNAIEAMNKVKKMEGLIIDLRGNPGGLLDEAVNVSDLFLDETVVTYTKDRAGDKRYYKSKDGQIVRDIPIVLLVDGGSASASEIVAGALQDHKRAILIGSKTFGKGSVQNIIDFPDGTAIKLTTARYYTPNGRSIQATGIVPDVVINDISVKNKDSAKRVYEKDLSHHISNDTKLSDDNKKPVRVINESFNVDPSKDYYLYEAINTLKIMGLSKR